MRVAVTTGNYVSVVDGVALTTARLVSHLRAEGHEVLVLAPASVRPALAADGPWVGLPSFPLLRKSSYRMALATPGQLARRLEGFGPDLLHIASPDVVGHLALRWARRARVPAVAAYHTNFPSYFRYMGPSPVLESAMWWWAREFYRRCRHVYVPSASMQRELAEHGLERQVRSWSRGVDRERFDPARRDPSWRRALGITPDAPVVSFVGRLRREKGVGRLPGIMAAVRERRPEASFVVVGEGELRPQLCAAMPGARFVGALGGDELARAFAGSDLFVQPSDTETFGNVTLEAMASGVPVVAVDAPGSRCLVEHGQTGLLAKADEIADALVELIDDPSRRQAMGERARQRSADYSWEGAMDELMSHYAELLGHEFGFDRDRGEVCAS